MRTINQDCLRVRWKERGPTLLSTGLRQGDELKKWVNNFNNVLAHVRSQLGPAFDTVDLGVDPIIVEGPTGEISLRQCVKEIMDVTEKLKIGSQYLKLWRKGTVSDTPIR